MTSYEQQLLNELQAKNREITALAQRLQWAEQETAIQIRRADDIQIDWQRTAEHAGVLKAKLTRMERLATDFQKQAMEGNMFRVGAEVERDQLSAFLSDNDLGDAYQAWRERR